jgi:Fe-S cluster biogenesis protein NfuA
MSKAAGERTREIVELVARVEAIPDQETRQSAQSLMSAILELHGAGLERMVEIVLDSGDAGKAAVRRLAGDSLVSSLLVLHDLHPDDIETRVRRALTRMSGSAELVGIFEGTVRIRLTGSACGLKNSVEAALREAAPDAMEFLFEEVAVPASDFVPVESLSIPVAAL